MKQEPEIVTQLREEEKIGILHHTTHKQNTPSLLKPITSLPTEKKKECTQHPEILALIEKLQSLSSVILSAIALLDKQNKIIYTNPSFQQVLNTNNKSDFKGKKIDDVIEDKKKISPLLTQVKEKGASYEFIDIINHKSTTNSALFIAYLVHDKNQQPIGTLIYLIPASYITDTKNNNLSFHKTNDTVYQEIFRFSPEAILVLDTQGVITQSNNRVYEWLSYKPEEIIGKNVFQLPFITPEGKKQIKENFMKRLQGSDIPPYDIEFVSKDGDKKFGTIYASLLRNNEGTVTGEVVIIPDITQRQQVWDELVKSEEKYRVLAETSADGVFTTDVMGRVTYLNPALEKLIGKNKDEIFGKPFRTYLEESSVYLFEQVILDVRKSDTKIENVKLEFTHKEGYTVPIEVNIAPLKKDERFVGIECTVRDISEREKIVRELKKSENLRTEFMNIAAHELKSPVTPIKGYLELIISDKDVNEKIKNWARISLRNAERLLRLVNDILDVARLDTDTMRFNMERINLREMLDQSAEDFLPAITKKNLTFSKDIPDDIPSIVGDKFRLSQVLKNLLGNAVKFTDHGSIELRAEKQGNYVLIHVLDTGIGISHDEHQKIFQKLYQAYSGEDRKNEGVGLGLFICREIVKKHRGDIWVESEIRKGSTFTVKLPI